jgi:hypothetical protein
VFKLLAGKWKDDVDGALEELEKSIAKFSKENNYDDGNIVQYNLMHEPKSINNPNHIYVATALVAFYGRAQMVAPLLVGRMEELHPVSMVDMTGDPVYPEV